MDSKLRAEESVPMWITSYNFISLMNLPEAMTHFGPLKNLWEGGGQGEKMIQQVKPIMRGLRKSWQRQVMTKLMCNMALNRLMSCQMQVKDVNLHTSHLSLHQHIPRLSNK